MNEKLIFFFNFTCLQFKTKHQKYEHFHEIKCIYWMLLLSIFIPDSKIERQVDLHLRIMEFKELNWDFSWKYETVYSIMN